MKQLQEAIKSNDIHKCRSIIIASIRQKIISKSQFSNYLDECIQAFGDDFFDLDDNIRISNEKDLFASIKINFSQKKINQLLTFLPDILDETPKEENFSKSLYTSSNNTKTSRAKIIIIILTILIIGIIALIFLMEHNIGENNDKFPTNTSTAYNNAGSRTGILHETTI